MKEQDLIEKYGVRYSAGYTIFREGDVGHEMYIIKNGKVRIWRKIGPIDKTLMILKPGDFFGEMSVLEEVPRSANATVEEDTLLLVLDKEKFENMLLSNGQLALKVIKKFSYRLRKANEQIEELIIKDEKTRVLSALYDYFSKGRSKWELDDAITTISQLEAVKHEKVKEVLEALAATSLFDMVEGELVMTNSKALAALLKFVYVKKPNMEYIV